MDELSFVPGDIIRIRRLTLRQSNFERKCHWVRNIVVCLFRILFPRSNQPLFPNQTFNPLRKKLFTPTSLEPNEVFESIDHTRVSDLTKWISLSLLRPTVKRFPNGNYFTVDAAFQVLYRFELNPEKGKTPACTVFICINGYPLVDFPTQDKYGLTWYGFMKHFHNLKANTSHPTRHLVNYQWEDVQRMYHKNEFITISAFGEKAALAVKPLDIIVIHNLLIKPDRSAKSNYSYLAYDPINCNMPVRKSLRVAHPESLLGMFTQKLVQFSDLSPFSAVALQKQILQYSYSWTLPPAVSSFDELKEQFEATGYRTDETDIESDDETSH